MPKDKYFYVLNKIGAGFGSEVNNLLYAIYYFEKKKYPFKLISYHWVSAYNKGWNDYFDSLQPQHFSSSFRFKLAKVILNITKGSLNKRNLLFFKILRKILFVIYGKYCFTRGKTTFIKMRELCYSDSKMNIDSFCLSMNRILNDIWILKPEIYKEIEKEIEKEISKDLKYISIHIRRGDKITSKEDRKYEIQEYIDALSKLNLGIKNIFLMSDDYNSYIEIKNKLPDYNIITFLNKNQTGYDQNTFEFLSSENIKNETIQLLTEIEIAKKSAVFIGTYGTNIFRLIKYFKLDNCINICKEERTWL